MSGDRALISCLVERLSARLPRGAGLSVDHFQHDKVVLMTAAAIVKVGKICISLILDALLGLAESLHPHRNPVDSPSPHILPSERYVLGLTADCCFAHWQSLGPNAELMTNVSSLDARLVNRIFHVLEGLLPRLPSLYRSCHPLSSANGTMRNQSTTFSSSDVMLHSVESISIRSDGLADPNFDATLRNDRTDSGLQGLPDEDFAGVEKNIKVIVEYVTLFNWTHSFEYFRAVMLSGRIAVVTQSTGAQSARPGVRKQSSSIILPLVSLFWADEQRLGSVISEISASFLYCRKDFQHAIVVMVPMLITRWLERLPHQFISLHTLRKRLDSGPDTLFDMAQTLADTTKRKTLVYSLQTSLLFLLPEVFAVASNLTSTRGVGTAKKVLFLENLRKAIRSSNDQAAYCLLSIIRASRLFEAETPIVSYALGIQDDIKNTILQRLSSTSDNAIFQQTVMTTAFVSLVDISADFSVEKLLPNGLPLSIPIPFRRAIIDGCIHFANLPNARKHTALFRAILLELIPSTIDVLFSIGRPASPTRPDIDSQILTLCTTLEFLESVPTWVFREGEADIGPVLELVIGCLKSPNSEIQQLASRVTMEILADDWIVDVMKTSGQFVTFGDQFWIQTFVIIFDSLPAVVRHSKNIDLHSVYSIHLISERSLFSPTIMTELKAMRAILDSRLNLLSQVPDFVTTFSQTPGQMLSASSSTEKFLLVSLCSFDLEICRLAASCLGKCVQVSYAIGLATKARDWIPTLLHNAEVHRDIASLEYCSEGMVAFHKQVRSLLRRLKQPTGGILGSWEAVFEKWLQILPSIATNQAPAAVGHSIFEWQNYSGFLITMAATCSMDTFETQLEKMRSIDHSSSTIPEEPIVTQFLRHSIRLLACSNALVRETFSEMLSCEISDTMCPTFLITLESEVATILDNCLSSADHDYSIGISFSEQCVHLIKALVENPVNTGQISAVSSVIGSLAISFARFFDRLDDTRSTVQAKIALCQLCNSIVKRKEHLNVRYDDRVRNLIIDHIFNWMGQPVTFGVGRISTGIPNEEADGLQKELNTACLRCLTDLTFKLALQVSESHNDIANSELRSQRFRTYFSCTLALLDKEATPSMNFDSGIIRNEIPSSSNLATTLLSNLLGANIDVGLKHTLSFGYHENLSIRTMIVAVLHNVMIQGAELSNLTDNLIMEKYERLIKAVSNNISIILSLGTTCPSTDIDELAVSLLTILERYELTFDILKGLIEHEIEQTDNEMEILRNNCLATKMLSIYAKWKGSSYLKATLHNVIEKLMLTAEDLDLELDPLRLGPTEDLHKNAIHLKVVAKVFIDDICASSTKMPNSFRKICHIVSSAVQARFPDARYTAVGAFIFLRFFCPAIVTPETEGLVTSSPTKEMRRGLLLITKVIQSLANNAQFGAKEHFMVPLNDFLAENIYRVTVFLHDISSPNEDHDVYLKSERFEFGSCGFLHQLLYSHGDEVYQKMITQESHERIQDSPLSPHPLGDAFRTLLGNLGPPPVAGWSRPSPLINNLPAYCQFQDFMFHNAFRGAQSFVVSRAVYDGGESKDGIPIICIILRNIDTGADDINFLIFAFFKISSRLWHEPFGLLIDATCCNGFGEQPEDVFRKIDVLSPAEMFKNMVRIYIYNTNSVVRKCLRRVLQTSSRADNSLFSLSSLEYHLLSNLQDLQRHFHIGQLHLPRETISVVTDTRFVFQPVTRLSKTKGNADVLIKVGSQYVQITTKKKLEIIPGLNTTINDIFRIPDIEEASRPSSTSNEDLKFTLRADNGKAIMYFASPKTVDILQAIKSSRFKYGKDNRNTKETERPVRLNDVPGTLLNIALANLASPDGLLRRSAYNLLGALCQCYKFQISERLYCSPDISLPTDCSKFIVSISKELSRTEKHLALDFVTEFFVGWGACPPRQRMLCLAYLAPWLPELRSNLVTSESDGEKVRDQVATLLQSLIDTAITDRPLAYIFGHIIWPSISEDDILLEILLDELMRVAMGFGLSDYRLDSLSSITLAIGGIPIRGKVISRLRKAINRSSLKPTKDLTDNIVWSEICVLLRFSVALAFDHGVQVQLYLPEVFHIVSMLAYTGSPDIRRLVYKLLINSVHSVCTAFSLGDIKAQKLKESLDTLHNPRAGLFAIQQESEICSSLDKGHGESTAVLVATESLTSILLDLCSTAAVSTNMTNFWRSRWMSLVASTAFQNNPPVQPRAFVVMGCLARDEVDDDLLYQVLVALRGSLGRFEDESNRDMVISIISSLAKMIPKLPSTSRYGLQLFWLAIFLLRMVPIAIFNYAAQFLEAVLVNINTAGELQGNGMATVLLQGRSQVEEAASMLDDAFGIRFNYEHFHFAVCACIVRGLTNIGTRLPALRVLSAFLATLFGHSRAMVEEIPARTLSCPYLALMLARTSSPSELKDCLWLAGLSHKDITNLQRTRGLSDLTYLDENEVLLNCVLELVDIHLMGDDLLRHTLSWLTDLATARPAVITRLCGHIHLILRSVINNSEDTSTLDAAYQLLQAITSTSDYLESGSSAEVLAETIQDMGFGGLWPSSLDENELVMRNFHLSERLIEITLT